MGEDVILNYIPQRRESCSNLRSDLHASHIILQEQPVINLGDEGGRNSSPEPLNTAVLTSITPHAHTPGARVRDGGQGETSGSCGSPDREHAHAAVTEPGGLPDAAGETGPFSPLWNTGRERSCPVPRRAS